MFLNIDLGELADEPEELYAAAHVANIACGGHTGDDPSMEKAVRRSLANGARVGAHPSFPDREGFGRRPMELEPDRLQVTVAEQCARLASSAGRLGVRVDFVKAHGALYHAASRDPAVAAAYLCGVLSALGRDVTFIGARQGALASHAATAGLRYAREAFADRATRSDGMLVPRGEPGALVLHPEAAAANARSFLEAGEVDTVCVHGDTPGAVAIAAAVRRTIDDLVASASARPGVTFRAFGDVAVRATLPDGINHRAVLEALRSVPPIRDVVVAERHVLVVFEGPASESDLALARAALIRGLEAGRGLERGAEHAVSVRYDGLDLHEAAERIGLSADELISAHVGREYTVAAIGFLPGFAYLRGLDPRLVIPRRAAPRPRVPALSVGIGGPYTGVYPFASPGGWTLLGTAVGFRPFDELAGARLALGDHVRFTPA
jgi:UPF0271 protein